MSDDAVTARAHRSRWPKRLAQGLLGAVLGLVIAEGVFWWRDDGAFPHVNFYVEDPQLAVRLEKNASERLAFGGNPTTTISTNGLGYRTHVGSADGAWPAPAVDGKGDVLVVGDSQVYGLGVEGEQTFSAKLAALTGRTVINGGVPTYGPQEYAAVVDEVLATRQVERVVFVVNIANDLFELAHPNTERHAVWDGWAVRKETAPSTSPTSFPGRRFLYSKSHLVFAIRAALHGIETTRVQPEHADVGTAETGVPSEGHWTDLVTTGVQSSERRAAIPAPTPPTDARISAGDKLRQLEDKLDERLDDPIRSDNDERLIEEAQALAERRGRPEDIVVDDNAESGRSMSQTATALLAGAIVRKRQYEALRAKAKADPSLKQLFDERDAAAVALDDAASHAVAAVSTPLSPLAVVLERVRKRCDEVGARLIVVVLPVDVMVSADEWKKYGVEPKDMAPTKVLISDIVRDAEQIGGIGIDVMPALVAAEPGAFLDRDLHLTVKGHAAVATVLAEHLADLPQMRLPMAGYPEGRSAVPASWEWERATEIVVKGSSAAGCETKQIREWLKVACLKSVGGTPTGVDVVAGGEGDAHGLFGRDVAVLLAPVLPGKRVEARFFWKSSTRNLVIEWPNGASAATIAFADKQPAVAREKLSQDLAELVDEACDHSIEPRYCGTMYGGLDSGCAVLERYGVGATIKSCLNMQPTALPVCTVDRAPAFATLRCRQLCDVDRPCGDGEVCTPWQGTSACLPTTAFSSATP